MALIPLNPPAAAIPERCAAVDGPRILKLWHLASLDAPTVAVAWACALAWAAHVLPAASTFAALGLAVWAIYVLDRLLDVRTAQCGLRRGLKERHIFHWRYRRSMGSLAAVAIAAAAWLVFPRLAHGALRPDGAVAVATLLYFGGVHGRKSALRRMLQRMSALVSQESVVAVIFTAGCALPALTAARHGGSLIELVIALAGPVCVLAALGWLNLRAIGLWEGDQRREAGVERPAICLAGLAMVAAAMLARAESRAAALVAMAAVSAFLLLVLDRFRDRLEPVTLRAAADLALLTPLLLAGFQIR